MEWTGKTEVERTIEVVLDHGLCSLSVFSQSKTLLRTVDLMRHVSIMIWTSTDNNCCHVLLHVPREYDLVSRRFWKCTSFLIQFWATCDLCQFIKQSQQLTNWHNFNHHMGYLNSQPTDTTSIVITCAISTASHLTQLQSSSHVLSQQPAIWHNFNHHHMCYLNSQPSDTTSIIITCAISTASHLTQLQSSSHVLSQQPAIWHNFNHHHMCYLYSQPSDTTSIIITCAISTASHLTQLQLSSHVLSQQPANLHTFF